MEQNDTVIYDKVRTGRTTARLTFYRNLDAVGNYTYRLIDAEYLPDGPYQKKSELPAEKYVAPVCGQ